jgi:hypothetical protein
MARINNAEWLKLKAAYQRGEGSCRELAEKWGVNNHTVEARCKREGWNRDKQEIARKVTEKVVDEMADAASLWVKSTIARANRARKIVDTSLSQFATDPNTNEPVVDMLNINTMLTAEAKADDIARRSFGLADSPQKHEVQGNIVIKVIDPYVEGEGTTS